MGETYNYSIEELEQVLNLLKNYQHTSAEIDSDIERLTYFIDYLAQRTNDKTIVKHISKLIRQEIKEVAFLKPFEHLIRKFTWIGKNVQDLSITPKHKNIIITDSVAVEDAISFLASHSPFFKEPLDEFSYDINSHLKFLNNEFDASGGTLYLKSTGEAYVFSANRPNISKTSILTHELEHVIDFFNNPYTYDNLITREVIPVFMELISLEHYSQIYNLGNEGYQRILYLYSILKERAHEFVAKKKMLDIANKYPNLSDDDLLKLLIDNGYSLEQLTYLVNIPIQDFYYQIPELIAIELYFLYQNDRKKVLSILQDISLLGNDNNILELMSSHSIRLTKKIPEFENHLLSKTKR